MMNQLKNVFFLFVLIFTQFTFAQDLFWSPESLHSQKSCLLKIVRQRMDSQNTSEPPALKIESETDLVEFQDAMEPFWKFRPEHFLNAYNPLTNTVYLMNARASYNHPRTPVDSLVHELVHFVQVHDKNMSLADDDFMEADAVYHQTWFRETYGHLIIDDLYTGPCQL